MKRRLVAAAVLACCAGITAASASVPNVPSPGAHKTPAKAKAPLTVKRRATTPATPKKPALSSAAQAQFDELMTRGGKAMNIRNYAAAVEAYGQAAALNPTNASAHYNLASAYYWGVIDWAKAEAEYRIALSYDPTNKYYKDGLDTVVRREAEEVVNVQRNRQYADQVQALNNEGVADFSRGDYAAAQQLFSRALEMQPANAQIRANLENARQQLAAEQRRQQAALQQQQYEQQQRKYAYEQAQRAKRNEFFNTVTQGLALGQHIAEANRPPPPPPPRAPQPTYSQPPRQVATASPAPYRPQQSAPQPAAAPSLGPLPAGCITLEKNTGGSFWSVVNHCPAAVIGDVCFDNDKTFNCGTQIPAGFGPIRSGGKESIYGPSAQATAWHAKACYYDDWNKGTCHF